MPSSQPNQIWTTGYFVLRGSLDVRDVFCASTQSSGLPSNPKLWLINSSIRYRGDLVVVAIPRGSEWSVTLSDVPVVRASPSASGWATWSPPLGAKIIPPPREAAFVPR